jgi:hypothetical protein
MLFYCVECKAVHDSTVGDQVFKTGFHYSDLGEKIHAGLCFAAYVSVAPEIARQLPEKVSKKIAG